MNKKKGFTLIELLAVIVILAIIALIATPIVLNIINDARESATLQSAQFYIDAVENAVAKKIIDEPTFKATKCNIQSDGNLNCKGTEVVVEIKGEKPTSGTITLQKGKITEVTIVLSEKTIVKDNKGNLVYGEPLELEYTIGEEVTFNPGDGNRTWNVIGEDIETVTLMMTENLGNGSAWYGVKDESHNSGQYNKWGPVDLLEFLNILTINWTNVDPIDNYEYINNLNGTAYPNGYQKIEIKNGIITLTHKDGNTKTLDETNKARARILSMEELFEIASKTNTNLTENNLRAFIADNLGTVNTLLQSQGMEIELTTVDEAIAFAAQMEGNEWIENTSKYYQTYITVSGMINMFGINPTHDISLPEYLYTNLDNDIYDTSLPSAYWTLTTDANYSYCAWFLKYNGYFSSDNVKYSWVLNEDNERIYLIGARPVITIPKSKLN